ncbi:MULTISPECIES: polysaccharide biosynthesis/export family protein [Vibrio]|jgi:polysaccharide export outer membrane protein|uniref:Capsular biosynthesis protein n=2 Tax=Vibrio harveyi TaxID=669 RepID=A0ABM5Y3W5_VIBHA|nr:MULTISPECIES: polysaccharide biosynthesis/export family protein [Vibrio]AIV08451.1 capsular biosynthesis protein [Vibrio harveyi]AMG00387.1 capsular biosynthesis protein [Vibrio harveyi]AWB02216.1 polysaccharide export protein [Vibrio harveyi]EKM17618.1 polysaccharide biosynthesis/export family protein [Vibrio harveyi]EKO3784759.1 polysaccharide export protein [Vibrio harveyi]
MNLLTTLLGLTLVLFSAFVSANTSEQDYLLDTGDTISVQVYGEEDLTIKNILITSDGYFDYPYLGRIKAINKTPKQLKYEIETGLKGDYLINPKVMVTINSFRLFYVNGEVRKPGGFEYQPGLTIEKAIALAGGLTDRASRKSINLTQHATGKTVESVNMQRSVEPGDIVFIDQSFF